LLQKMQVSPGQMAQLLVEQGKHVVAELLK
jgi:hypothetical protein